MRADRVFQHLDNAQVAVREMIRVVKPGGVIVITDSYWGNLKVEGVSDESSEAIRKTYLTIVKNPLVIATVKDLILSEGINETDIFFEKKRLEFQGFKSTEAVLWMEDSLREGFNSGAITEEEMKSSIASINAADQDAIMASFDFYLVRIRKP